MDEEWTKNAPKSILVFVFDHCTRTKANMGRWWGKCSVFYLMAATLPCLTSALPNQTHSQPSVGTSTGLAWVFLPPCTRQQLASQLYSRARQEVFGEPSGQGGHLIQEGIEVAEGDSAPASSCNAISSSCAQLNIANAGNSWVSHNPSSATCADSQGQGAAGSSMHRAAGPDRCESCV